MVVLLPSPLIQSGLLRMDDCGNECIFNELFQFGIVVLGLLIGIIRQKSRPNLGKV